MALTFALSTPMPKAEVATTKSVAPRAQESQNLLTLGRIVDLTGEEVQPFITPLAKLVVQFVCILDRRRIDNGWSRNHIGSLKHESSTVAFRWEVTPRKVEFVTGFSDDDLLGGPRTREVRFQLLA